MLTGSTSPVGPVVWQPLNWYPSVRGLVMQRTFMHRKVHNSLHCDVGGRPEPQQVGRTSSAKAAAGPAFNFIRFVYLCSML